MRQGIQFLALGLKLITHLLALQGWQCTHIHILGMKSIDGNTVVGIRVCPRVIDGRIIDGQYLNDPLSGQSRPINHAMQVTKVTDTETTLTTERKDGDDTSGPFPIRQWKIYGFVILNMHLVLLHIGITQPTIVACFPSHHLSCLSVQSQVFVISHPLNVIYLHRSHPHIGRHLHHAYGTVGIPLTPHRMAATDGQHLATSQARSFHTQYQGTSTISQLGHSTSMTGETLRKGRSIEISLYRYIAPMVAQRIEALLSIKRKLAYTSSCPLAAKHLFTIDYLIMVFQSAGRFGQFHFPTPAIAVRSTHHHLFRCHF